MSKISSYLLAIGLTALITAALVLYYFPRTEYLETVKWRTLTKTRIIKLPNGTEITETEKESEHNSKIQKSAVSQWHISASAQIEDFKFVPVYGLTMERRILGPFFLGASINTDTAVGVHIGMEF